MPYLDKYATREKYLRQLEREVDRLCHAQGNAPVIPLEHPFQRGWVMSYVLRADVTRRPDVDLFRKVLAVVNQRVYSRNRDFVRPNGDHIVLRPRIIPFAEWDKYGWSMSQQRLFGYGHWRLEDLRYSSLRWRCHVLGFKLISTWWLEEDIQPHLITHQRVELPEVRERLAEIEAFMTARTGWPRLNRLHGHKNHWRGFEWSAPELRAETAYRDQFE
jgi:hypothetical protein